LKDENSRKTISDKMNCHECPAKLLCVADFLQH